VTSEPGRLEVRKLGQVPYLKAIDGQRRLVEARKRDEIPDQLLLLEHPSVITVGVSGRRHRENLLASPAELARRNIDLLEVSRGGDVTYHGPGQLVGYPILDLKPDRCDVHRYVRDLEEALMRTVARFGVTAGRVHGLTGIWVGNEKLAAIGVRLSRWVTSHGFALNVTTQLDAFELIVPCGIRGRGVTSLERLLGAPPAWSDLEAAAAEELAVCFERSIVSSAVSENSTAARLWATRE